MRELGHLPGAVYQMATLRARYSTVTWENARQRHSLSDSFNCIILDFRYELRQSALPKVVRNPEFWSLGLSVVIEQSWDLLR